MKLIKRNELEKEILAGRVIQKDVGRDAASPSGRISMGFARYSEESGAMEPHQHAEEVVYILSARQGYVRLGNSPQALGERIPPEGGMTLHLPPLEWHVFEFDPGGYVDIIFIYGQVDQIRPEEMQQDE